jgi:hypothetical protein
MPEDVSKNAPAWWPPRRYFQPGEKSPDVTWCDVENAILTGMMARFHLPVAHWPDIVNQRGR